MIEIGGVMRPCTSEEAAQIANESDGVIEEARQKVYDAQKTLHKVCVGRYPVGTRVEVNIAARRSPTHEVIAVNEHGWLTLRNIHTGTTRGLSAESTYITASRCWYEKMEKESK